MAVDRQTRTVALKDFFKTYKQVDLQDDEQLLEIRFEIPGHDHAFSYEKISKRTYLDIASVNSALCLRHSGGRIEKIHLSAGGLAPFPLYLAATCEYLQGQAINPERVRAAAETAQGEIAPVSDIRGSAAYKRLLLRQLVYAHFLKLFPDAITWEALHGH